MVGPEDTITVGELVRRLEETGRRFENRLDEIVRRMEDTFRQSAERESRFEQTFLPRREYELTQQTDAVQLRGFEAEVHKVSKQLEAAQTEHRQAAKEALDRRRQDRALILSALVFPILVALITAALIASGS